MNKFIFKKFISFLLLILVILFLNWLFNQINTAVILKNLVTQQKLNDELSFNNIEKANFDILNDIYLKVSIKQNTDFSFINSGINNLISDEKNDQGKNITNNKIKSEVKFPININEANIDQLCAIPGIGPTIAQRIIDYRNEHGPFLKPEDLLNVKGIGEKKLENMLKYITF